MTGRLTQDLLDDAKRLLTLLGVPWIQAPSEGEAQAAYMARKGAAWGVNSRDYDSLLFGAPKLVRYVTIQGEKWLPSKGRARKLEPELIDLEAFLGHHGITRKQLVDVAILIGTDFNEGIRGIGPKTGLSLVKKHCRLEELPEDVAEKLPGNYNEIRQIYLKPDVTDDYNIEWGALQIDKVRGFLCGEKSFSSERVEMVVKRMRRFHGQKTLGDWLQEAA
jgi:flap endonuclease-1